MSETTTPDGTWEVRGRVRLLVTPSEAFQGTQNNPNSPPSLLPPRFDIAAAEMRRRIRALEAP